MRAAADHQVATPPGGIVDRPMLEPLYATPATYELFPARYVG